MSATTLYVKACRCLYSSEGKISWDELFDLLPQIRIALSCRVCRGLVVDPQSSKYCQHYVCKHCLSQKKALNPGCKWCLDWSKLQESDRYIRVILACYKLLCKTIKCSRFYKNSMHDTTIATLLEEGISNSYNFPDLNNMPCIDDPGTLFADVGKDVVGSRGTNFTRESETGNVENQIKENEREPKNDILQNDNVDYSGDITCITSLSVKDKSVPQMMHYDGPGKGVSDKNEENQENGITEVNCKPEDKGNNNYDTKPLENDGKINKNISHSKTKKRPVEPLNYCHKLRFERKRNFHQMNIRRRKHIDQSVESRWGKHPKIPRK